MRARQVAVVLGLAFALLAVLVVVEWSPLMDADHDAVVFGTDLARDHDTYRRVMKTATWLLNSAPVLFYTSMIAIAVALKGRPGAAIWLTAVVAVGSVLNPVLKQVFHRDRPTVVGPVESFDGLSFPSGHAASAALMCSALALLFWSRPGRTGHAALVLGVVLVPLLCGWTRITLGGHYPSDVVGGTLWGVAWVAAWHPVLPRLEQAASARSSRRRDGAEFG
jgi:membrane-associated phospholipid phosphatase